MWSKAVVDLSTLTITKSNESFKNDSFPKKFYQCMASVAMCIAMFGFATMLCDN